MKRTYSIGLFVGIFLLIILSVVAYLIHTNRPTEHSEQENQVKTQNEIIEDYYIMESEGYVIVYKSDQKTVFEYSTILFEDLPVHVQESVKKGMRVTSPAQVYSFLENYSS